MRNEIHYKKLRQTTEKKKGTRREGKLGAMGNFFSLKNLQGIRLKDVSKRKAPADTITPQ